MSSSVPSTLRVPFVAVEFDSSRAQQTSGELDFRGLLIGQKLAAGSATADKIYKIASADEVVALAGRGSQLHRMAKAWFRNNKATETLIGVLVDAVGGVAATSTVTITGPATAAGAIDLYIAGERVQLAVASADAQTAIATALAAAINANTDLPVTAVAVSNVVTLTARHKGLAGNDIDVRVNYQDGEKLPAGVTVAIVAMASGATNPTLTSLIAAMGDSWYHVIAHPYTDATSLTAIETEMASRFGPMRPIDGMAITSAAGTQGTLSALGDARNSGHSIILGAPGKNPVTPPCEFAAGAAAVVALAAQEDPARPSQTLVVQGALAPAEGDRFTLTERDVLLHDGIATTVAGADGSVQLDRLITTYQTNAAGTADTAYLDATSLFNLMYQRWSFRNRMLTRFPRHKLADNGTRFAAGQPIVTPKIAKAEAIAWAREMEERGLIENVDQFKTDLVVERDANDPNRLNFLLPPDLINGLIVRAANIQFRQ